MLNKSIFFKAMILTSCGILQAGKIDQKGLFIPKRLGNISLHHTEGEFTIKSPLKSFPIQSCFMDKELRGISKNRLATLLAAGSYLSINKMDESNEYSLKLMHRLRGGGLWGATFGFYAGKFATHFVGHGAILLVACCTGPAFPVTLASLEATFLPVIEATSNAVAIGTAVLSGVATGPV